MVIVIDYHTDEAAEDIVPEEWMGLIVGHAPERRVPVRDGWKRRLDLEFADDSTHDHARMFGDEHAHAVSNFFTTLVQDAKPFALAVRCVHGRHNAAAIALALGERIGRYVPAYAPHNRRIRELLGSKLGESESRTSRRSALAQRIHYHLKAAAR